MTEAARYIVGVDVGGTFTDIFFLDEVNGVVAIGKVPTTRPDQALGIVEGIRRELADLGQVATIVHGTTVGTNTLLERTGAPTGLITTAGFRDVLEMRRRDRPQTWGLWGDFEPVVPRERRLEVPERVLADGTVRTPVAKDDVVKAAEALTKLGAQAVAIFFVNSYANSENERVAVDALRRVWPNEFVNASSEILPEIREFERCSTTALNAYLQPVVGSYLQRLDDKLREDRFDGQLLIVQSNGGVMTVDTAASLPVRTAYSGPAAGVIAGVHIASAAGLENVVTCDMGGTSFDVSVIARGKATLASETAIDFGLVVRTPMIEITTIGAGGGSIASVDKGNMLRIGPESAGSDPGPVSYGLGNDRPTVTDANVVLGRINADRPIGDTLARLDVDQAARAIEAHIGGPLGLDAMAAAEAIVRVANSKMAGAIRLVSIERGHDPAIFAAMSFGGAASLHIGALIEEIGFAKAVVPRYPGVTSALGCVIADMRHDFVHTVNELLDTLDPSSVAAEMRQMAEGGMARLDQAGVLLDSRDAVFELDMSYVGQTHTVNVPLPLSFPEAAEALTRDAIRSAFEATYRQAYGRLLDGIGIRVLNLRTATIGRRPKFDPTLLVRHGARVDEAPLEIRKVWIDGAWTEVPIYDRLALAVGAGIDGPALLEQSDTTIFLDPRHRGDVDPLGNFVISRVGAA